LDQQLEFLVRK